MPQGNGPKKKPSYNHDGGGEVPTITSLLGRKKPKSRTQTKITTPPMSLDESHPIDLSELQKEATESQLRKIEPEHPPIDDDNPDLWDTRGINRAVKKAVSVPIRNKEEAARIQERSREVQRQKERSQSLKIQKMEEPSPFFQDAQVKPLPPADDASRPAIERFQKIPSPQPTAPLPPPVQQQQQQQQPQPQAARVQPAASRGKREVGKPLTQWTMDMLKGGPDPLGKGLSILLERGGAAALFMAIAPPPAGSKIPLFTAAATARPTPQMLEIWTGLKWDPSAVPHVWNQILKSGFVELHHATQATPGNKNYNNIRSAFGMGSEGILMLIRVGPVAACRGILAVFSHKSLLLELGPILTLFNTPLPLTARTG